MEIDTQKFVRKPLYVDAVRVSASNFDSIAEWCQGEVEREGDTLGGSNAGKQYIKVRVHNPKTPRQTKAFVGDWILYTERGYKVYTNKAFHMSFDRVRDDTPLFYIDPETGYVTEKKPHEGAMALNFDELIQIIRNEIAEDESAEPSNQLPLETEAPEQCPVEEEVAPGEDEEKREEIEEETPAQEEQMPSEPVGVVDTDVPVSPTVSTPSTPADSVTTVISEVSEAQPANSPVARGKRVLTRKDQVEMGAEEVQELLRTGAAILAQDLQ